MGRIQAPKTIRAEDFPQDAQETVTKLAFVLNNYLTEIFSLVNGNIDFFNLAQSLRTITVTTGAGGVVTTLPVRVSSELNRRVAGVICVSARNPLDPSVFVNNTPFVTFSSEPGQLVIQNISGLPANSQIQLTLVLIGG